MAQITLYAKAGGTLSTVGAGHTHPLVYDLSDYYYILASTPHGAWLDIYTFDGSSETLRVSGVAEAHGERWVDEGAGEYAGTGDWTPGATIDLSGAGDKLRVKLRYFLDLDGWEQNGTSVFTDDTGGRGILQTTAVSTRLQHYLYCEYDNIQYGFCLGDQTYIQPTFADSQSFRPGFYPSFHIPA